MVSTPAAPPNGVSLFHAPVDAGGPLLPAKRVDGALVITEEPAQFGRFRYKVMLNCSAIQLVT